MTETKLELSKPPIVEASLRMAFNPLTEELFEYLSNSVGTVLLNYSVDSADETEGSPRLSLTSTTDNLHTVRITQSDFIFSRLAPYAGWDQFRNEAKRVWSEVRQLIGNANIHTFGLRYINKLQLPVGKDVEESLRLYPHVPDDAMGTRTISNVFMQLAIKIKSPQGILSAQLVQLQPELPDSVTMVLDNQFDFAGLGLTDALIWEHLEEARELKNHYFVQFLTPQFLEQYR